MFSSYNVPFCDQNFWCRHNLLGGRTIYDDMYLCVTIIGHKMSGGPTVERDINWQKKMHALGSNLRPLEQK